MQKIENDIRQFMKAAGQSSPDSPIIPDEKTRLLRAKLIFEEAIEQCEALGVRVTITATVPEGEFTWLKVDVNQAAQFEIHGTPDLTKVADGAADQIYVSVGCAIACGIRMPTIWQLVQDANMAKFGKGSYKREDGKQMKPPSWQPPDAKISEEITAQSAWADHKRSAAFRIEESGAKE